ncbi:MAG TPA: hypothetical protein ENJ82_06135 [Bacteroidetes bacterium]|nr:hypothetical protein [Bacteroidota bacterium]
MLYVTELGAYLQYSDLLDCCNIGLADLTMRGLCYWGRDGRGSGVAAGTGYGARRTPGQLGLTGLGGSPPSN